MTKRRKVAGVRVVTSNLHAGVDGWGRATPALATAVELGPDILVAPEMWRGDSGDDFVNTLTNAGYQGHFAPVTRGERVTSTTPPVTSRRWQPWSAHLTGERGLYYGEHRSFSFFQRRTRARQTFEAGTWGLGLFTRLPLRTIEQVDVGRLWRERVRRVVIVATIEGPTGPCSVVAVHGAHLSHGSPIWFHRLRQVLNALPGDQPVIVAGDFNAWAPVLRLLLPGWTHQVRARTWPRPRPHSQIDHIVTRGGWRSQGGGAVDGGSDHFALYADLDVGDAN